MNPPSGEMLLDLLCIGHVALSLSLAWISWRLLVCLRRTRPDLAMKHVPGVLVEGRHPREFLFFLTSRAKAVLAEEPRLLRLRNVLVAVFATWLLVSVSIVVTILLLPVGD